MWLSQWCNDGKEMYRSVTHVQSCCVVNINLLLLCRSRCRRRRRWLSFQLLWSRNFATMVTWRHTSPLYWPFSWWRHLTATTRIHFNSPYACLRQTSKFHHQVSFSKYKVAKFCINEFPGQYSWKEYPRIKSANAKNFAFKRGLVVKFARLTQSRIRAICLTFQWQLSL